MSEQARTPSVKIETKMGEFRCDLLSWGQGNKRAFPWREEDSSLYEVFLAEFLLTQTPAENVEEVHPELLERFPTLEALSGATFDELAKLIQPLGLQNRRAGALLKIADGYDQLPRRAEEMVELPRVGRYVTDATLCFALDHPRPVVDTNVRRVYGRLFGPMWPDEENEQWDVAEIVLPEARAREFNLSLIDFGAEVCTPRDPDCGACFARDYCDFYSRETESPGS